MLDLIRLLLIATIAITKAVVLITIATLSYAIGLTKAVANRTRAELNS